MIRGTRVRRKGRCMVLELPDTKWFLKKYFLLF